MNDRRTQSELQPSLNDPRWLDRELERLQLRDPILDVEQVDWFPKRRKRRKAEKLFAVGVVFVSAHLACSRPAAPVAQAGDSVLVQLASGAAPPAAPSTESGPSIVALEHVAEGHGPLLRVPVAKTVDETLSSAVASSGVVWAEPIPIYQAARVPNDPRVRDLWGLTQLAAPAAWARTTGSAHVVVAIVDDGIAVRHADLEPNLWSDPDDPDVHAYDFTAGRIEPLGATHVPDSHGTQVSGVVGAAGNNGVGVVGVNWRVSLMGLRGLAERGGRADDLARAIDFASSHGARVINLSWTGAESRAVAAAIARAEDRGALVIAAAGNDASEGPSFPARLGGVISVAATTPADELAAFSNRGALVGAPGVGILSTMAPAGYARADGTSVAAPYVSGIAALLFASHPEASRDQVRRSILESSTPVPGIDHGRVDAARALAALDSRAAQTGGLELSSSTIVFPVGPGRRPKPRMISVHADGQRTWRASVDVGWIRLSHRAGQTPDRIAVFVEPDGIAAANEGVVRIESDGGDVAELVVRIRREGLAVIGEGCTITAGVLHAKAGAGCALAAGDGDAPRIAWTMPGGERVFGSRFDGLFMRRGSTRILVSADEGEVDEIPVRIE